MVIDVGGCSTVVSAMVGCIGLPRWANQVKRREMDATGTV